MNRNQFYYNPFESSEEKDDKEEIVAETLSGGQLKVQLSVRFAIAPGTGDALQEAASVGGQEMMDRLTKVPRFATFVPLLAVLPLWPWFTPVRECSG